MWWCYDWVDTRWYSRPHGFGRSFLFFLHIPQLYRVPVFASAQSTRKDRLAIFLHSWYFFSAIIAHFNSLWIYFGSNCHFLLLYSTQYPLYLYRLFWIRLARNLWMVHKNRYQLVCHPRFRLPASHQPSSGYIHQLDRRDAFSPCH